MSTWVPIDVRLPEPGTLCRVITPGGEYRDLIYDRNLWWLPDQSMYVYFTPTFWQPKQKGSRP